MKNYFFLDNYVTSEGAVSHIVLYYQPLSITHYQMRFYDENYFENLPIVSTAFKTLLFLISRVWVESQAVTLVSLSKTLNHCFVLRMGRKVVGPMCCVTQSTYQKEAAVCAVAPCKPL